MSPEGTIVPGELRSVLSFQHFFRLDFGYFGLFPKLIQFDRHESNFGYKKLRQIFWKIFISNYWREFTYDGSDNEQSEGNPKTF